MITTERLILPPIKLYKHDDLSIIYVRILFDNDLDFVIV